MSHPFNQDNPTFYLVCQESGCNWESEGSYEHDDTFDKVHICPLCESDDIKIIYE